jgi:hypothetical protein
MGLPEVRRAVTPPVAPAAKKKNMPPRSFGWRSLALAFSSCIHPFGDVVVSYKLIAGFCSRNMERKCCLLTRSSDSLILNPRYVP